MYTTSSPYTCPCLLCNATDHALTECRAVMPREDKVTRLREGRACFRFGRRNHVARECRNSRYVTCDTCQGRHITVLCDIWRNHIDTAMASRPQSRNLESNSLPTNQRTLTTSVPTSETKGSSVLLQTTRAWALGQKRGSILVRLLLNTGSQRSFITSKLSDSLQCLHYSL